MQESAPIYVLPVTAAAGEYRMAASAAQKLQSLGAMTMGNRQALGAGAQLAAFNILDTSVMSLWESLVVSP